nr:hypothetical protein HK105_000271 [Polyrhizophydium stewartii]
MLRLPTSTYAILLRTECVTAALAPISNGLWLYVPGLRFAALEILFRGLALLDIALFAITELEFLKLMAPFVSWISPNFVFQLQIATGFAGAVYVLSSGMVLFGLTWAMVASKIWVVGGGIFSFFEMAQQVFFIYFILRRMPRTTLMFRIKYSLLVGAASLVYLFLVIFSSMIQLFEPTRDLILLHVTSAGYHLVSMFPMLAVRAQMAAAKAQLGCTSSESMTDLVALDYGLIAYCAFVAVLAISMLPKMLRLPTSTYAILLRTECVTAALAPISNGLWLYVPGLRFAALEILSRALVLLDIALFAITELEFLKLMAPFVSWISPNFVFQLQIATGFGGVVYILSSGMVLFGPTWAMAASKMWVIGGGIIGFFEMAQQMFFIYFILRRMPRTTLMFRIKYSLLVGAASLVFLFILVGASIISLIEPTREFIFLDVTASAYHLISMFPMLAVRAQMAAAKASRQAKRPPARITSIVTSLLRRSKRETSGASVAPTLLEMAKPPMPPQNTAMHKRVTMMEVPEAKDVPPKVME